MCIAIFIALWLFIGFATFIVIDEVGFPRFIWKRIKEKKASILFSIAWPLYYIVVLIWVICDFIEWIVWRKR